MVDSIGFSKRKAPQHFGWGLSGVLISVACHISLRRFWWQLAFLNGGSHDATAFHDDHYSTMGFQGLLTLDNAGNPCP